MDFPPVANTGNPVQVPNVLQAMSSILGIQQQRQALETAAAGTVQAQQSAREVQAGAQLLSDPIGNGILKPDGKTPTDNAQSIIMAKMPTTGAKHFDNIVNAARTKVEFDNARNNLSMTERQEVNSSAAGLAAGADSPDEVKSGLQALVESKKGTPVYEHYQTLVSKLNDVADHMAERQQGPAAAAGKEPWRQAYLQGGRAVLGAQGTVGAGGIASGAPSSIDTGAAVQPGVTAPALQGGGFTPSGTPVPKGIPPGAVIVKDANDRQFVLDPHSNRITPIGAGGAPASGGGSTGGQPKFTQPIPGQANAQKEVETTRSADADYGVNRHINNTILRLSASTDTGPGTETWHHALGAVAGPLGGNNVADYQTIGAMLDRQAALSAKQMGLPDTNAGLATAASLSGTTKYQPDALQTKVKLTDALVEGAHKYRLGLDRVIGTGPNQDLSKYQEYRQAWASNFDPNVFALDNAHARTDQEEVTRIVGNLSPEQAALLHKKTTNLRLLEQGIIPK